jgi:hydroxyacylglutathione hydrolase
MANLKFARMAEPLNLAIADREQSAAKLRKNGEPTVPFSIATELATNPFIRSAVLEIADRATAMAAVPEIGRQIPDLATLAQPVRTLATLRAWKNIA